MLFPPQSEAPPAMPPSASSVVDATWECPEPQRLVERMDRAVVHRLCGVRCSDDFHRFYDYFLLILTSVF